MSRKWTSNPSDGQIRITQLLTAEQHGAAINLLQDNIPWLPGTITSNSTGQWTGAILRAQGLEAPSDVWLGAKFGERLVGVVHASVPGEAEVSAIGMARGLPDAGSPDWLVDFVRQCVLVQEIAVVDDFRSGGIGRLLLTALHEAVDLDPSRAARSVIALLTTEAAHRLFASLNYTIGAPGQPVPSAYMNRLETAYDPVVLGSPNYSWAYRLL